MIGGNPDFNALGHYQGQFYYDIVIEVYSKQKTL